MVNGLQDQITRVAYDLYEKSGRKKGNDLQNWLAAEKIVYFDHMFSRSINGSVFALLEYKPLDGGKKGSISPAVREPRSAGQRAPQKADIRRTQ